MDSSFGLVLSAESLRASLSAVSSESEIALGERFLFPKDLLNAAFGAR